MVLLAAAFTLGLSTFAAASPLQYSSRAGFDVKSVAVSYVAKQWKVSNKEVYFQSSSSSPGGTDALLRQVVNDQPVWNSYADVKFDTNNNVADFDDKHFSFNYVENNMPNILLATAVSIGSDFVDATWTDTDWQYTEPDHLGYVGVGSRAKYDYVLHFKGNKDAVNYTAYINAFNGVVDWVVETDTGKTIFENTSA